jgi:hypothetical protein
MEPEPEIHITIDNSNGASSITPEPHHDNAKDDYGRLLWIIFGIAVFSIALTLVRGWSFRQLLDDFIATYFIVFAGFKFVHIETFALAYRRFDKIAQRLRPWAYLIPFVEAILGFAYMFVYKNSVLNIITILIVAVGAYGVRQTKLAHKRSARPFRGVFLGNKIQLPLSTVCFIGDVTILILAAILLFIA